MPLTRREPRRYSRSLLVLWCALMVGSCGGPQPDDRIPAVDGALALELRYPTEGIVLDRDSIALWGTVGTGRATLRVNDREVLVERNGAFADFIPLPATDTAILDFVAERGGETRRQTIRILRKAPAAAAPRQEDTIVPHERWLLLRRAPSDTADSATQGRPIYSRWAPDGGLAVPLQQESRLFSDVRTATAVRLRLANDARVWVPAVDVVAATSAPLPLPRVDSLRLSVDSNETVIRIPATERLNTSVELALDRMHWTIWSDPPSGVMPTLDTTVGMIQQMRVRTDRPGRTVIVVRFSDQPLGWKSEWRDGNLLLRIRSQRPLRAGLRGLIVALDPGHPPGGTTGPTGYTEPEMTLAVARAAAERLEAAGARPVLLRDDEAPVSLDERLARAERAGAHVLISIHGNSPGPGRPPRSVLGTQTIWLQPIARPLANAMARGVRHALGQVSLGAHRQDFAINRTTWLPSVLVEGTGLVIPEREAFLRTPEGIGTYADGIVAGLEDWLSGFAGEPDTLTAGAKSAER